MPEKEVCRVQGVQRRLQRDCLWEGAFTSSVLEEFTFWDSDLGLLPGHLSWTWPLGWWVSDGMTHISVVLKHDVFRLLSIRDFGLWSFCFSCSSDERMCQVVKAQIWELEDLASVSEAATAYLWFWTRQRMTDVRCRVFQIAQGSLNSAVIGLNGTFSLDFGGNKDFIFQTLCEEGRVLQSFGYRK